MDVSDARAFIAVAEELHFGRAAERLRIAQPPLSRQIKRLEKNLGAQLFERSTRHVSLTPAGKTLVEPAKELLIASEHARDAVQGVNSGNAGHIRIGFAGASTYQAIGKLARATRAHAPGLDLEFFSGQFSDLGIHKVFEGDLELTIGRWDYLPEMIGSHVIALEKMIVFLSKSHPLAQKESISITDLANESWISLPRSQSSGSALSERWRALSFAAGFVPKVSHTAPEVWTQMALVGAEMGCAVSVDSIDPGMTSDNVVSVPIREATEALEMSIIWRKDADNAARDNVIRIAKHLFPSPYSSS